MRTGVDLQQTMKERGNEKFNKGTKKAAKMLKGTQEVKGHRTSNVWNKHKDRKEKTQNKTGRRMRNFSEIREGKKMSASSFRASSGEGIKKGSKPYLVKSTQTGKKKESQRKKDRKESRPGRGT